MNKEDNRFKTTQISTRVLITTGLYNPYPPEVGTDIGSANTTDVMIVTTDHPMPQRLHIQGLSSMELKELANVLVCLADERDSNIKAFRAMSGAKREIIQEDAVFW